jgi:hypothetical protein
MKWQVIGKEMRNDKLQNFYLHLLLIKHYWDYQLKEDMMGMACSKHGIG